MDYSNLNIRLKRYLARWLKRPEDIEDVIQESFLKVLEAGSKGEIHYSNAYLYRTAHNVALNMLSKKSYHVMEYMEDFVDETVLPNETSIETAVAGQQRFEQFCQAAAQLPEQCRKVLILRKVYGFSQQEVAERLGISISTVEKHLTKGLVRCADYLKNQDIKGRGTTAGTSRAPQKGKKYE